MKRDVPSDCIDFVSAAQEVTVPTAENVSGTSSSSAAKPKMQEVVISAQLASIVENLRKIQLTLKESWHYRRFQWGFYARWRFLCVRSWSRPRRRSIWLRWGGRSAKHRWGRCNCRSFVVGSYPDELWRWHCTHSVGDHLSDRNRWRNGAKQRNGFDATRFRGKTGLFRWNRLDHNSFCYFYCT